MFWCADTPGAIAGGWFHQRLEDRDPDAPTYIDPRRVTSEHCYYSARSRGYAYVKLVTPMELALAIGDGQCPDQMPSRFTTHYL